MKTCLSPETRIFIDCVNSLIDISKRNLNFDIGHDHLGPSETLERKEEVLVGHRHVVFIGKIETNVIDPEIAITRPKGRPGVITFKTKSHRNNKKKKMSACDEY